MYYFLLVLGLLVLAYLLFQPRFKQRHRNQIAAHDFPVEWERSLINYWPLYQRIPPDLKKQLQQRIQLFMAEKTFEGCQGFEVSEYHKVFIAAQACLLIINKPFEFFDSLEAVLVYPTAFIIQRNQALGSGIYSEDRQILSGESWQTGKVIVSWDDTIEGMVDSHDGKNVVIHEFAHLLDHETGSSNGAPYLNRNQSYEVWSQVLSAAYERLQHKLQNRQGSFINYYGASSPAEFFAVISEIFFEQPELLKKHEPALYLQLGEYYDVDPVNWGVKRKDKH